MSKLESLIDQYLEIVNSTQNKKNAEYWSQYRNWNRDKLRPIPKLSEDGKIPFVIVPDNSLD